MLRLVQDNEKKKKNEIEERVHNISRMKEKVIEEIIVVLTPEVRFFYQKILY